MLSLFIPAVKTDKLHRPGHLIHGDPMPAESKVVIDVILNDMLIGHDLHIVIVIAFFLQHVIELKFRGLTFFGHLNEPVYLVHVWHFLWLLFLFLEFWFCDHSAICCASLLLDFDGRFDLFLALFALHFVQKVNDLS